MYFQNNTDMCCHLLTKLVIIFHFGGKYFDIFPVWEMKRNTTKEKLRDYNTILKFMNISRKIWGLYYKIFLS